MDILAMLELISVQRHDFVNHLQVISGLLQLNKGDKVRDYIRQVGLEVDRLSKVIHIKNPYVAAALLLGHHQAEKHQVMINYNIHTDMDQCAIPGEEVARVLRAVLSRAVEHLASPEAPGQSMDISITETDSSYLCRITFPETVGLRDGIAREVVEEMEKILLPCGGRMGLTVSESGGEIHIFTPREQHL